MKERFASRTNCFHPIKSISYNMQYNMSITSAVEMQQKLI